MIPNALQPANITEVFLYTKLGRAIVMVPEDQLSLAIGRRGQNVRLASQLTGWRIDIHSESKIYELERRAKEQISSIPAVSQDTVARYDVAGRAVKTLASGTMSAGVHTLQWDATSDNGSRLSSGVYFYRLTAGKDRAQRKMVIVD